MAAVGGDVYSNPMCVKQLPISTASPTGSPCYTVYVTNAPSVYMLCIIFIYVCYNVNKQYEWEVGSMLCIKVYSI